VITAIPEKTAFYRQGHQEREGKLQTTERTAKHAKAAKKTKTNTKMKSRKPTEPGR